MQRLTQDNAADFFDTEEKSRIVVLSDGAYEIELNDPTYAEYVKIRLVREDIYTSFSDIFTDDTDTMTEEHQRIIMQAEDLILREITSILSRLDIKIINTLFESSTVDELQLVYQTVDSLMNAIAKESITEDDNIEDTEENEENEEKKEKDKKNKKK